MRISTDRSPENTGSIVFKNTFINLFSRFLLVPIGIISIQFLLVGMGIERYGLFSLSWTIINYMAILDFGISTAVTKYMAEELSNPQGNNLANIFWTAFSMILVLGLVISVIFFVSTPFIVENVMNIPDYLVVEAKRMFWILAFSIPFILMNNSLRGGLEAGQRFDIVNLIRTPYNAGIYLIPLVGYIIGWRIDFITALLLIPIIGAFLAYSWGNYFVYPELFRSAGFRLNQPLRILRYSGWVAVSNGMSAVFIYTERILISAILSVAVLAYYSVPYDTLTRLWIIPTSITAVLLPVFSETSTSPRNNEVDNRMISFGIKFVFLSVGPLAIMLAIFSKNILNVWIGSEIAENSAIVASVLVIGVFINSFGRIPATLLNGKEKPDIPAKFTLIEFPCYVVGALFLMKLWGINGAAVAWTLRVSIDTFLLIWIAIRLKFMRKQEIFNFSSVKFLVSLVMLAAVCLIAQNYSNGEQISKLFIMILTIFVGYSALAWLLILDKKERDFIINFTHRLIPARKSIS